MLGEVANAPMREAIARLEAQYEADKRYALENQRREYEKQFQHLRSFLSPATTPMAGPLAAFGMAQDRPYKPAVVSSSPSVQSRLDSWGRAQDETFQQGLAKLRQDLVVVNGLVREANCLAQEMGADTSFGVTLQIPPHKLTPNRPPGTFLSEPAILVRRRQQRPGQVHHHHHQEGTAITTTQVWSVEKLEMKLIDMRELYEEVQRSHLSLSMVIGDGGQLDPFYETADQHHLIGVANIFLEVLFHSVRLAYQTPIISQQGEVVGRLHAEIERTGGSLTTTGEDNCDNGRQGCYEDEDDNQNELRCRFTIKAVTGLPPSLSQYVFCQYLFPGETEAVKVPPTVCPPQRSATLTKTPSVIQFRFEHSRDICLPITEELVEHCAEGALSIEVYGHVTTAAASASTAATAAGTSRVCMKELLPFHN